METIKLDLIPGKKMPSLHASQFDDGRAYHIDLTENRVPYVLDGTETISVIIRKCDNTLVSMDIANTFANKSYLEFEVVEQMTACAGFNYGEIILEKNGDRLGSLNFYLQVETAPDENGITSQSEIKNLTRQVHDIVVEELADNGAEETGYDNTESGLEATNVQDAIDELANKTPEDIYTKEESDDKFATKTALEEVSNEVENIRIGADGTTYPSAGDAVRGQIDNAMNNIDVVRDTLLGYINNYNDDILTIDNRYISLTGTLKTANTFHASEMIAVDEKLKSLTILSSGTITGGCAVAFYSENRGFVYNNYFISGQSISESISVANPLTIQIPQNAKWYAFSCRKSNSFSVICNYDVGVSQIAENIDAIINGNNLTENDFSSGYIDSSGAIYTSSSNSNFYSDFIKNFNRIKISCTTGYRFSICFYNGISFVNRSGWYNNSSGEIIIDNNYNCRINIATATSGTSKTIAEMLPNFQIIVDGADIPSIERNKTDLSQLDWISKMVACQASGKVIHFSFDDTWQCLYSLITTTPTSIWDIPELRALKTAHETYGMCFSLNTFNKVSTQPAYDIANMPNTWASEWQAVKDWLKFSFHAKDDNTSYATATTLLTDYNAFVNAVYAFTGDYDCIDRVPRLGYFGGTKEQLLAIKNANYGAFGFLTADDSRISYYFNQEQTDQVNNHGRFYDAENGLFFIKSLPRLDSNTGSAEISIIEEKTNIADKYIECFAHSLDMVSRMADVASWSNQHGFTHGFLMDYFK